jgi:uncharacterized protein (TIGR03437 family)
MRPLIAFVILTSAVLRADFTTYVGGPNDQYKAVALATDSQGNTYVTGLSAFVTKLDPTGIIVFTKSFAGFGYAIAVDPSGNVWVGGYGAPSLPLVNPLQSTGTGFLVKMAPDGTVLYSSYFGGALGESAVNGIATDQSGNVYVTGWTDCSDFPTTAGLPASAVNGSSPVVYGLFAAKLNSTGQKILYSTVIAGRAGCQYCVPKTVGAGIAVDGSGDALVAGATDTAGLPLGDPSGSGAFVFKINASGNQVDYFRYLASSSITLGTRPIAVDDLGNAYLTGYTDNPNFPATPGAYQTTYNADAGNSEASAMKLDPTGKTVWATLLNRQGGPNMPNAAISLDSARNVWLTGTGPDSGIFLGGFFLSRDFVAELSADGSALLYATDFPPAGAGQDIALDQNGVVHVAGSTGLVSTITPAQPAAPRVLSVLNAAAGQVSGLIAPGEIVSLYGSGLGPATPVAATPQDGVFPRSLAGVQVLVNGTAIPLLYVSDSQINAEFPSSISGGENGIALVRVMNSSKALPDFRLSVVSSDFAAFSNPGGSLLVLNQDGAVNKIANPAKRGSIVSIWATGLGSGGPPASGAVALAANNFCSSCQVRFSTGTTSKDITETVQYAGSSPGLVDGLIQINFMIPIQLDASFTGAWVSFTPPGSAVPMQIGWVNVAQ